MRWIERIARRQAGLWGLVVLCLCLYIPGLSTMPPLDRDEPRFAQASKQMVDNGDYIDIRFQDQPRYKKPIGIYWLQSLSVAISGDREALWAYRLPSLLGMMASVLLLACLGRRLFEGDVVKPPALHASKTLPGRRLFEGNAGIIAGGLLAVSLLAGVEARLATTDGVLLFCILAVQGILARAYLGAPKDQSVSWPGMVSFWGALAGGILIKGPVIVICSGLTVLTLCIMDRQIRWLGHLRPIPGIIMAVLLVSPWYILIGVQTEGAFFIESLGGDFLAKIASGQESHGAPPGYYSLIFWLVFWPGSLLAIGGACQAWKRRMQPEIRFLLAWILPYWILLEMTPTKLPHYVLPVLPAVALLSALAWQQGWRWGESRLAKGITGAGIGLWGMAGIGLAVGIIGIAWNFGPDQISWAIMAGLCALGVFIIGVGMVIRPQNRLGLAMAGVWALLGFYGLTFGKIGPGLQRLWVSPALAEAFVTEASQQREVCPVTPLAVVGYGEPSLVFLTSADIRFTNAPGAVSHLRQYPHCGLVAVEQGDQKAFLAALKAGEASRLRRLETIKGLNYAKGKPVSLTLYRWVP